MTHENIHGHFIHNQKEEEMDDEVIESTEPIKGRITLGAILPIGFWVVAIVIVMVVLYVGLNNKNTSFAESPQGTGVNIELLVEKIKMNADENAIEWQTQGQARAIIKEQQKIVDDSVERVKENDKEDGESRKIIFKSINN